MGIIARHPSSVCAKNEGHSIGAEGSALFKQMARHGVEEVELIVL
jgi:hypothetical protein